jgi:16S rRNA (adenine1518-N6/adenine1519-N6)-dimethyltransferase
LDLSVLPPLRDVIESYELRAKKALGQNFLCDLNLTSKIARAAGDISALPILEIGPGPGGLTRGILMNDAKHLVAVEYDPRAVLALQPLVEAAQGRLQVVEADALQIDVRRLFDEGQSFGIIANLPYNIATPLLVGWLRMIYDNPQQISHMTLMFQREVVDRITASVGSKAYGRLGVLVQWLCQAHRAFDVPAEAFTPPPKVVSAIAHIRPRLDLVDKPRFSTVEEVTAAAFGQRRKMLRASLKPYPGLLETAGIDGTLRAEQIDVADFIKLARILDQMRAIA